MNTIIELIGHIRKQIETRFSPGLRPQPCQRRRFEVQLEFPWQLKR